MKDERQIRMPNNRLLGYKAKHDGKNVIAIMKGSDCKECLGFMTIEQIQVAVEQGPYVDLNKVKMC